MSLTSPRHKSCAVTIDDTIVITGGTMLGLGRVKPVWLAEIGTRTAESFDGENWTFLPSLSRAKVEHGCSVATISGSRGVLVVGGATGDDVVEFLDWDIKYDKTKYFSLGSCVLESKLKGRELKEN